MNTKKYILQFGFISSVYLLLTALNLDNWAWYLKPFLIPFLLLAVYAFPNFASKKWLLLGLLFSWIGDVVLMFAEMAEIYFILGLLLFLTAHIFYIILFVKQTTNAVHKSNVQFWIGFGVVALYLFGMLSLLFPKVGNLKLPIGVYASTISLMLIEAFKGYFNWNNNGKNWVLIGAFAFVVSDSLLAINKFYAPFLHSSLAIMSTYIVAQLGITYGILRLNSKQ